MVKTVFIKQSYNGGMRKVIKFEFNLHLSAEEYLQYYQGVAKAIQVTSRCGKKIQFSADKMRPFVLKDGVHGSFVIALDENNKFLSVSRIR